MLGAGPAGLTAAYVLARRGRPGVVFEADGVVGGLARTVVHDGYRFDLGGHRFFTKLVPVQRLWEELLGEDFLVRPRLSRIYYDGKFLVYPLEARDIVSRLGVLESARCTASYVASRRRAAAVPETFEDWVTARFGKRLYDAFFRSYTEKIWGIPGSEIRAEWAAQRIRNFSLGNVVMGALGRRANGVTTLIERFHYPRLGPGQMWETLAEHVESLGIPVRPAHRCVGLLHAGGTVEAVAVRSGGAERVEPVDGVISTIPLDELVRSLDPPPPADVRAAAAALRYRALCVVAIMTRDASPFPDNWIYLHDPGVRAGRVQNFGAWSGDMVVPGTTCLGVEYFCFEGDELWRLDDARLIELASTELSRIGLLDRSRVLGGKVVRSAKAYPVYDGSYRDAVATIRRYLGGFANLQTCGRNGLHRYNNQDHSMWTGALAAVNLCDGARHDVWSVNVDEEYLEEGSLVGDALGASFVDAVSALAPRDAAPAPAQPR